MKLLVPALLLLALALPATAQDTISTDRPDFTEATSTVGVHTLQAEFGFSRAIAGDDHVDTAGEGVIRYGLRPRFELRLGLPSRINVDGLDAGLGDMSVGVKWNAADFGDGGKFTLVSTLVLPTGQEDFTGEEVQPSFFAVASLLLTDRLGIAGQTGAMFFKSDDAWDTNFMATTVLGLSLIDNLGAFAGIRMDVSEGQDAQFVSQIGLTYLISRDFQVDVHGGAGLTDATPDQFFGFGLAYRR